MIYRPAGVDVEPEIVLTRWRAYNVKANVDGKGNTVHFVGLDRGTGRICSPVQSFDKVARTAVTRSGRKYFLEGEPANEGDYGSDGNYVFDHWLARLGNPEVEDITDQYISVEVE